MAECGYGATGGGSIAGRQSETGCLRHKQSLARGGRFGAHACISNGGIPNIKSRWQWVIFTTVTTLFLDVLAILPLTRSSHWAIPLTILCLGIPFGKQPSSR